MEEQKISNEKVELIQLLIEIISNYEGIKEFKEEVINHE